MTQLKNKNEFTEDGKLFIREIESCDFVERRADGYKISCRISNRGFNDYYYNSGDDYIIKSGGIKFWLMPSAKEKIENAVSDFEKRVTEALKTASDKIEIPGLEMTIYLFGEDKALFFCKETGLFNLVQGVTGLVHHICDMFIYEDDMTEDERKIIKIICKSDEKTIKENPLYLHAVSTGNELMALKLRLLYNLADKDECIRLSKLLGVTILPALPEEYDKTFFVEKDDFLSEALRTSCYNILHVLYFSMKDRTHKIWEVNPGTKVAVDAALVTEENITSRKFFELFGLDSVSIMPTII